MCINVTLRSWKWNAPGGLTERRNRGVDEEFREAFLTKAAEVFSLSLGVFQCYGGKREGLGQIK